MHQDQTYLILGASGDIGSQLARQLVAQGSRVFLAGKTQTKLATLAQELHMPYQTVDATNCQAVLKLFEQAQDGMGSLHGAVNCVGSILLKPAHLLTETEWQQTLAVNLTSAFALVRAAAKTLLTTGGSVVLVSAAIASIGIPNHEAISAAKAGVNGLMLAAAATYAANHLRFNCVAPGLVATQLTEKIIQNPHSLAISLAAHPLGRVGKPEEIARVIAFLLDPDNSWITGQIITIDGGLSCLKELSTLQR